MFYFLNAVVWVLAVCLMMSFLILAERKDWRYINRDSRQMYVDLGKSLVTSAGIASSIIVGTYARGAAPAWMLGRALIFFVVCIIFSIFYTIALSRLHEIATTRGDTGDWGPLRTWELILVLVVACVALGSFLTGFLYVGRIGWYLAKGA